jgi:hypothetical protein
MRRLAGIFCRGVKPAVHVFLPALALVAWVGCADKPTEQPRFAYPDYLAKLSFKEDFQSGLGRWEFEGNADTAAMNGSLSLASVSDRTGCMLWAPGTVDGNYQVEFTLDVHDSAGAFALLLCAGPASKTAWKDLPPRTGRLEDYTSSAIQNYWIGLHQVAPYGKPDNRAVLRKNPGNWLLNQVDPDPCGDNRSYLIDVIQLGNRILVYADERQVMDVRDKGGFSPIYSGGRIGFWMIGQKGAFRVSIKEVRVFKLTFS